MTLDEISFVAAKHILAVHGAFHLNGKTLVLLGPDEPDFWVTFSNSSEFNDGESNPLDRWSKRVIDGLACEVDAEARYPFSGPAYHPFISWALASGRAWNSPVSLLVHDISGLFISFRGALIINELLALPATNASPCDDCAEKPCLSACPAAALDGTGYDVQACHRFLDSDVGTDCMTQGCQVRRACPVGQRKRMPAQSNFHMRAFHKG